MEDVTRLSAESPVVIFSKTDCCMTYSIEKLIRNFGANPTIYELDDLDNGREMEKALIELGCDPSVPAVFIGRKFIGGSNEIISLNIKGKLKPLLIKAKAVWI